MGAPILPVPSTATVGFVRVALTMGKSSPSGGALSSARGGLLCLLPLQ
jgi:hypothetical protein